MNDESQLKYKAQMFVNSILASKPDGVDATLYTMLLVLDELQTLRRSIDSLSEALLYNQK